MIVDRQDQKKPLSHYLFRAEATKRVFDALEKGITLINSYFIISSLSLFSFGLYQLILSLVSIVRGLGVNFFDGVVTLDIRRYFNVQRSDLAKKLFQENVFFKLVAGVVMASVVFFGSGILADFYGQDVSYLIKWASILLVTGAIQSLTSIFLQSVISFSQQGLNALREILKLMLIASFLFWYKFGISEVVIIHVIAEAAATLVFTFFVVIKKYRKVFLGVQAAVEPVMVPLVKTHGPRIFVIFGLKEVLQDAAPWLVKIFTNTEGVALYSLALNLIAFIQDFMPLAGIKPILALKADNPAEQSFIFMRAVKYTFWLGTLFLIGSLLFVPPVISFIFPKYIPAIPVFMAMSLVLPLYGVVKIIHTTLASLREYKTLAMRLVNEMGILFIGSALLLPIIGVVGIGFVYLARLIERTVFLYSQLVRRHPIFRIKPWKLFRIDATDKQFMGQILLQFRNMVKFTK